MGKSRAWIVMPLLALAAAVPAQGDPNGGDLYASHCARCHEGAAPSSGGRIPSRQVLSQKTPDEIFQSVFSGVMRSMRGDLSGDEVAAVATYLTGKAPGLVPQPDPQANLCKNSSGKIDADRPHWIGWGRDLENSRFQPDPGFKAAEVPRLKLKWAFAYPGYVAYGQPAVYGGRVYVTTLAGRIFALDAATGCTAWSYDNKVPSRTAISAGPIAAPGGSSLAVWFGDDSGAVTALDASSGKLLWRTQVDAHKRAQITGAPKLHDGKLYVPVSSLEEAAGIDDTYPCCTFRGSVTALDAAIGKPLWKSYTVADEPKVFKKTAAGRDLLGPAGVSVWASPTIDTKRGVIYATTGNTYTDIDVDDSDAIIAIGIASGVRKWVFRAVPGDHYLFGCETPAGPNCPSPLGPDLDFYTSAILRNLPDGKSVVLATSKNGQIYAVDPDRNGTLLWKRAITDAFMVGGIGWGAAADDGNVYVAYWNGFTPKPGQPPSGITALKIETGEPVWDTPGAAVKCAWGAEGCMNAQRAAVTVIPGAVFSGSSDGHLRAYATKDGRVIWDVDTAGPHPGVNGADAVGGSIDSTGPVIVGGAVFVNSGYGRFMGRSGNALLIYTVDGK